MKSSEQDAGSPLIGIPAKIADGFFLVALNDTKADEDANLTLLRGQDWIDVPVVYKTGRRALLTMADAAIGGDDARAGKLAVEPWRADEVAAKQDGECAHGRRPYQPRRRNGSRGCRHPANFRLRGAVAGPMCRNALTGCRTRCFADRLRGRSPTR